MNPVIRFILLLIVCLHLGSGAARAQSGTPEKAGDTLPPYRKYPTLPAFNLLLPDSVTVFNTYTIKKGKPSVLILFSPDCSHCEQLTKMLLDNKQALEHVNIIMASPLPLYQIREFITKNGLSNARHIIVGHDPTFFFWSFFRADTVPFIVVYDKNKKLAGEIPKLKKIDDLLDVLKKAK